MCLSDNLSMLFITESWFTESVANTMLDCSHCYTMYRLKSSSSTKWWWSDWQGVTEHSMTPLPSEFDPIGIVAFCVITAGGIVFVLSSFIDHQSLTSYVCLLKECSVLLCFFLQILFL